MRREHQIFATPSTEIQNRMNERADHIDIKWDILHYGASILKPDEESESMLNVIKSDWNEGLDMRDLDYYDLNKKEVQGSLPAFTYNTYLEFIDQKMQGIKSASLRKTGPSQIYLLDLQANQESNYPMSFAEEAYFYTQEEFDLALNRAQAQGVYDILGVLQCPEVNLQVFNKKHIAQQGTKKDLPKTDLYTLPTLLDGIHVQYRFSHSSLPIPDISVVVSPLQ